MDDLLIGAPNFYASGIESGRAYLFFGATISQGGSFDVTTADALFSSLGGSYEGWGTSVASAGDVDGDGLSDVLIGSKHDGALLYLGAEIGSGGVFFNTDAHASFLPTAGSSFSGSSVASAGDVDGDGLDDLLIGEPEYEVGGINVGMTYLFYASTVRQAGAFNLIDAPVTFSGSSYLHSSCLSPPCSVGERSGTSIASAGDVDGDGLGDLLIGAPGWPRGNRVGAGRTYLMFGSTIRAGGATFQLTSDADATFEGENEGDKSGSSVSCAGDVNGDGFDDLLIGAPNTGDVSPYAGKSYLFLGSLARLGGTFFNELAHASFAGEAEANYCGDAVASGGDINGDGLADLLIAANGNDQAAGKAGKTYLVFSPFATPDYAGLWTLDSTATYSCHSGSVSAQLDHLVIDHVAPYATVSPMPELTMDSSSVQPGLLEGGFVTSATPDSFALSRTESLNHADCTVTWSLTGSYTGPDTLTADFTADFTGLLCGDCTNQSFPVTATR